MRSAVKNEQIEQWAIMGKYDASNMNDLSPDFLPIMDSKMVQYPPKMGKMGNIPQKGAKTGGMRNLFSLFIYKFWTFFCHLPIPPKWGDS